MIKHIKHIFAEFEHGIDKWDDPRERMFEGTMVKGRPTRGFGDSTFNYAGKLYEPEPWTHKMQLIKVAAEDVASRVFDKEIKFTFCFSRSCASNNLDTIIYIVDAGSLLKLISLCLLK